MDDLIINWRSIYAYKVITNNNGWIRYITKETDPVDTYLESLNKKFNKQNDKS